VIGLAVLFIKSLARRCEDNEKTDRRRRPAAARTSNANSTDSLTSGSAHKPHIKKRHKG
jgi:hypothetical protein